jgi:hypothetical protein
MTVGELKARLEDFDPNMEVVIEWDSETMPSLDSLYRAIDAATVVSVNAGDEGCYEESDGPTSLRVLNLSCE